VWDRPAGICRRGNRRAHFSVAGAAQLDWRVDRQTWTRPDGYFDNIPSASGGGIIQWRILFLKPSVRIVAWAAGWWPKSAKGALWRCEVTRNIARHAGASATKGRS